MTNLSKLKQALAYASKGWKIFPVTPSQKTPLGALATNGYHSATTDLQTIHEWWNSYPDANIGLNLEASGLVCVDVDSYKEDCEFDAFIKDKTIPSTLMQQSASGGTHYIFAADPEPNYPGVLCKGVDIKYRGYVLLAPSTFNGSSYKWLNELIPEKAPSWLAKQGSVVNQVLTPASWLHGLSVRELLQVIDEEGWHRTVVKYVASLVAKQYADKEIHKITDQLTLDGYHVEETRLEVQRMIDGARRKKFGEDLATTTSLVQPIVTSAQGNLPSNYYNVSVTLRDQSPWVTVFAYNEFADRKMVLEKPPGERGNPNLFKPRDIRDSDYTKVIKWLNQNGFPTVNKQLVIDCVQELCEDNIISPVKAYLESLKFDPVSDKSQLSTWMEIYLGVKPRSPSEKQYVRAVSRLSLIQAVARALTPGCKADSVPILEGGQGVGKSTALRILHSPDWFGDALPPMGTKDASDYLRGKWGIELAELAFQRKADIEAQKAFISKNEERFRPAYGREEIFHPRTCVFWGTTNRTDYIKDETGNRRFLPIRVEQVDIEGLKGARDQLWAEAVHYFKAGEKYWLSDDLLKLAEREANERFEEDPWVELVQQKLSAEEEVSIKEAIETCFDTIDAQSITTQMTRRMSLCLTLAGWQKDGRFTSGERRNQSRFVRGPEAGPIEPKKNLGAEF